MPSLAGCAWLLGWFEVEDRVFEGGTDLGLVVPVDSEGGLVPDDLPGGMSVQEMVVPGTEQDSVRVAGITTMFPMLNMV